MDVHGAETGGEVAADRGRHDRHNDEVDAGGHLKCRGGHARIETDERPNTPTASNASVRDDDSTGRYSPKKRPTSHRPRSNFLDTNEVFFRDTAHGFIAWVFATVLSTSLLGAAATLAVAGATAGVGAAAGQAAPTVNPSQVYVDRLFRTDTGVRRPHHEGAKAASA